MDEARYNLRSKRRECQIPIQLQMAGDEDFMATLGPSCHDGMFDHVVTKQASLLISCSL